MTKRLAILLSGRGSNFVAIHEAIARGDLDAEIAIVISNRPEAAGIEKAKSFGLPVAAFDHRAFDSREAHEAKVIAAIEEARADLVILAGYMRLLSAGFVDRFERRILNIHPSLLPSFPGVDAQRQALEHGVRVTGCTVHLVDRGLDSGPIIIQRPVPVADGDTVETLSARILVDEHIAYVEAIRAISTRPWHVDGRRVVFDD